MSISSRFLRKLGFVKKKDVTQLTVRLEAFTVDNGGARLMVLLLADLHLLEAGVYVYFSLHDFMNKLFFPNDFTCHQENPQLQMQVCIRSVFCFINYGFYTQLVEPGLPG